MKSIENKTSLILDLFFCLVFMPALITLSPVHSWLRHWPLFFIVTCTYMYGCYFFLMRINVPKLLISKKYCKLAGMLGAPVLINYILSLFPLPDADFVSQAWNQFQTQLRNFEVSSTLWLMFSLVMGYSLTISFIKELYEQLLLKKNIEAQRDKAELAVFKAQISPHFLFNTLNSLYSLVIGTSEKAENAFIKFTEILEYTYITIEKETVPLKDEIAYIQNYIDLQSIRLNSHTTVDWRYDVDNDRIMVPPMLMLTFVENAFKYGSSTIRDCTIVISLTLREGLLEFRTCNNVMKHKDEFRKELPVGIDNCRARLGNLFPGKHSLVTEQEGEIFRVSLKIQLD
ncbi:MAG: sensor histidine kinase [Clostridium sp.]|nr:sensor histidine kinase [Bacteroides sp.]MCM1198569.1 sensor histidine kinase [Clostridium sp.]